MTKPAVLIPILSKKNINIKTDDVICGNEISTYDEPHVSNVEVYKIEYGNYNIITDRNKCFYWKIDS